MKAIAVEREPRISRCGADNCNSNEVSPRLQVNILEPFRVCERRTTEDKHTRQHVPKDRNKIARYISQKAAIWVVGHAANSRTPTLVPFSHAA
jgi:hypothetical protein